jgi:hypothetical protein
LADNVVTEAIEDIDVVFVAFANADICCAVDVVVAFDDVGIDDDVDVASVADFDTNVDVGIASNVVAIVVVVVVVVALARDATDVGVKAVAEAIISNVVDDDVNVADVLVPPFVADGCVVVVDVVVVFVVVVLEANVVVDVAIVLT